MLAVGLLLPMVLEAQPRSIRIRQGTSVEYSVQAEIEMKEVVGDRESMVRAVTGGIFELTARRVSRQKIEWTYQTPEIRVVRVSSTGPGEGGAETTVEARSGRLATDSRGRVVSGRSGTSASLTPMIEALQRGLVQLWFQPAIFRGMKPGQTWSEKRDERIRVDDMGIDIRARYTVGYRFDGIVDTLGTKAVRVSWSTDRMQIDGQRTSNGVSSPVRGDGDHFGTSYFSTIDGLLLACVSENSLDVRVSPEQGGGVIPMAWRLRSESTRR